jgi:F-type H+-transporting ATPase subunit delta
MAELATLARPYAQAAFQLAKQKGALSKWSEDLSILLGVYSDEAFRALISASDVKTVDIENAFVKVCGDKVDAEVINLLRLMLSNGRLTVLSEIVNQFEELKSKDDGVVEVKIETAFELEQGQVDGIVAILAKRLNKKIDPSVNVDRSLIGGVRINVGDQVWDASVRGRLQDMETNLTN